LQSNREVRSQNSHLFLLSGIYRISGTLQTGGDISYGLEPKGDFTTSRDQLYYTLSLRHIPAVILTQSLRYTAGYEKFKITEAHNSSNNLSYSLKLAPLPTLEFSIDALTRLTYIGKVKSQEANSLFFQAKAQLLDALTIAGSSGYNRANLFESHNRFDTWTHRVSGRGTLIAPLDISAGFLHQSISSPLLSGVRVRRHYSGELDYRMTGSIMARAAYAFNDEERNSYTSQEYSLSWNLSSKISTGGMLTINATDGGGRSQRGNARLTYLLSSRTMLFFTYSGNDFEEAGRPRVDSYQVGLKTGF